MKKTLFSLILFASVLAGAASEIRLHSQPQTSLAARVASIRAAGNHIDIESFYLEDDRTGRSLLKEIIRQKSGKPDFTVRLLLDSWGSSSLSEAKLCELKNSGIQIKVFNKDGGVFNQQRSHRKIWITDTVAFAGGRNLSEENFSVNEPDSITELSDWDIEMRGDVLKSVQSSFEQSWNSRLSKEPNCENLSGEWIKKIEAEKDLQLVEVNSEFEPAEISWYADVVGDSSQRIVREQATKLIHDAKVSIEIENAFFMPVGSIMSELGGAQKKKLRMEFYLNGPNTQFWMAKYSTCLPLHEIQWWISKSAAVAFTPPAQKTHAKSIFVDSQTLAIGSFNLDARSINTNAETLMVIRNAPKVFAEYSREHKKRMQAGVSVKNLQELYQKYNLTEAQGQECSAISGLKSILKNFF